MADPLQPLRDIRVLDLSRYLPEPSLTRLLADLDLGDTALARGALPPGASC